MLELKNICKKYDREVLKKINLKFGNKGFICLVGESGSGKTTLLNIIGGLEQPDSGKVIFNGNNIKNIDSSFYSNQLVSFINQNYNLIDKYTVLENILLPIELRRIRSPCNVNKILKMLEPITFPSAISTSFFLAATIDVTSSGRLVPIATMVSPISV